MKSGARHTALDVKQDECLDCVFGNILTHVQRLDDSLQEDKNHIWIRACNDGNTRSNVQQ